MTVHASSDGAWHIYADYYSTKISAHGKNCLGAPCSTGNVTIRAGTVHMHITKLITHPQDDAYHSSLTLIHRFLTEASQV